MIRTVDFAYVGARMQARYGRLVPTAQWERMLRLPTVPAFVQAARDTALRSWLVQLDPSAGVHQIEAHLRTQFRRHIDETAEWAPRGWRPALAWAAVVPDLPAISHRLRGGESAWMPADPRLAQLFTAQGASRAPEDFRDFRAALSAKRSLVEVWLERWRKLWPETTPEERRGLDDLVELLRRALRAAVADSATALASLEKPLRRLFRRNARKPAGLFAYLALVWIEFTTLRGALLRRRLSLPLEAAVA